MKKYIHILLFLMLGAPSFVNGQSFREMFLETPDSVMPLLTRLDRYDFIEYMKAGMRARATNRLDGESVLKELTANYLFLQTTPSSSMQMKMLPLGNDSIMCVVNSVRAEAEDSRIAFFNREWKRLDAQKMFVPPVIRDFFVPSDTVDRYVDKCDIYLVSLRLNPDDNTMVAEYTMPGYMSKEDAAAVGPLLRKLVYRWNGKGFVIE